MMSATDQEKEILAMTADLWNALLMLPNKHPCDDEEHMRDIHSIQCRILARVAKRTNPELVR